MKLLTPSDLVLLILHGFNRPVNASEVCWKLRQIQPIVGGRLYRNPTIANYLQDSKERGLVQVDDKGFSLTKVANDEAIPNITVHLSDDELEAFGQ